MSERLHDGVFLFGWASIIRPLVQLMLCLTQGCLHRFTQQVLADTVKLLMITNCFPSSNLTSPLLVWRCFLNLFRIEINIFSVISFLVILQTLLFEELIAYLFEKSHVWLIYKLIQLVIFTSIRPRF